MTLYIGGFSRLVTLPTAPIATGRSDPCREGLAPSQEPCLSTAHAYFVLSPENGSFASVACASYRKLSASTAAPEPHDFAVRFRRVRLAPFTSIASHRTFVTIASAPQSGETGGVMPMICVRTKAEYF